MNRSVVLFQTLCPFPVCNGMQRRNIDTIRAFTQMGYQVHVVGSHLTTHRPWTQRTMDYLQELGVSSVQIEPYRFIGRLHRAYLRRKPPGLEHNHRIPFTTRRWLSRVLRQVKADAVVLNYAYSDPVLNHRRHANVFRIMDMMDMLSLTDAMYAWVDQKIPSHIHDFSQLDDSLFDDSIMREFDSVDVSYECSLYDQYDLTITISQDETKTIQPHLRHSKVVHIPVTYPCHQVDNTYDGPAVFAASSNGFNMHALGYFINKILPLIRQQAPDFCLRLLGDICKQVDCPPGVEPAGYVDDLADEYQRARLALCPLILGTGQKIKIVEAMSYGVPVVATRQSAVSSPIKNEYNSFIAADPTQFAQQVLALWRDPQRATRMGENARQTIANEFSQQRLIDNLGQIFNA